MKRLVCLLLLLSMLLSACGAKTAEPTAASSAETTAVPETTAPAATEPEETEPAGDPIALQNIEGDFYCLTGLPTEGTVFAFGAAGQQVTLIYGKDGGSGTTLTRQIADLESMRTYETAQYEIDCDYDSVPTMTLLSCEPLVLWNLLDNCLYAEKDGALREIDLTPYSYCEMYNVDGAFYLYSSATGQLMTFDLETETATPLFTAPVTFASPWCLGVTPDGKAMQLSAMSLRDGIYVTFTVSLEDGTDTMEAQGEDGAVLLGTYHGARISTLETWKSETEQYDTVYDLNDGVQYTAQVPALHNGGEYYQSCPRAACGDYYLFAHNDGFHLSELLLWDYKKGDASPFAQAESGPSYTQPDADYGDLSVRAAALSARYGVTIALGSNAVLRETDYDGEVIEDRDLISYALDVLEDTLSKYPDGYFPQLAAGRDRGIVFYLCGRLTPTYPEYNIDDPSAVTMRMYNLSMLAINIRYGISQANLVHELSHVLDDRLTFDGVLDEDAWNALNPEGFSYESSYFAKGETTYGNSDYTFMNYYADGTDPSEIYFYDDYAKTFPTEDRARMMENLLNWEPDFYACPHIQEKLRYYSALIRQDLDTTGWTETPFWEAALEQTPS